MSVGNSLATWPYDAATLAWLAVAGTTSDARLLLINNLVVGLKADGVFSKLDRLFIFAAETQTQALTDLIAAGSATSVNAPTFAANVGYTGNGSNMHIDSNFNPSTASSPNWTQNSACVFAWNNTSGATLKPAIAGGTTTTETSIQPFFTTDSNNYFAINNAGAVQDKTAGSGATGLYLCNRTSSGATSLDTNGVQTNTGATASAAVENSTICALRTGSNFGLRQVSCLGLGGGLTASDRVNIYNRLRTYMTAVGLP